MKELPPAARAYWFVVVAAATVTLAGALASLVVSAHSLALHDWLSMAAFATIALVGESMSIPLVTFGEDSATHSIGSVAAVAGIVVLPLYAAIPLIPMAMFWTERRAPSVKSLFNIAESTLSVAAAGLVFHIAGAVPVFYAHDPWPHFTPWPRWSRWPSRTTS